jgi:hypothetical protein
MTTGRQTAAGVAVHTRPDFKRHTLQAFTDGMATRPLHRHGVIWTW